MSGFGCGFATAGKGSMTGQFSAKLRRFARNSEGATIVEFALIFPIVLMMTFGTMEISLYMASMVTLEGGLKEASRYGITSKPQSALTGTEKTEVPLAFKDDDNPRLEMIGLILNRHTLNLIDLDKAEVDEEIFDSFSVVKDGEPYNDLADHPNVGNPPNGKYDGPGTAGFPPDGEPFSDMNCDGVWTPKGPKGTGPGAPGDIVAYTVKYNWKVLTPIVGQFLGKPDPDAPGRFIIPMTATIVVKNEPNVSGSSFCKVP